MAFPHPKSRKDHYRNEYIPRRESVLRNVLKRTIDIANYRNGKDDVNPAKNRTLHALAHDSPLTTLSRPVGRFNTELLCVLRVQSLPAGELHHVATGDAADRSPAEKVIQNIEGNVPSGSTHRDEAAIDIDPQRQARAASNGFEFPPRIVVLEYLGSLGSRHSYFNRHRRSDPGKLHGSSNRTQVPIDVEGRPFAQMGRLG